MLFEVFFTAFPLKLGVRVVSQGNLKVFSVTVPSEGRVCSCLSYLFRELYWRVLKLIAIETAPADVQKLS